MTVSDVCVVYTIMRKLKLQRKYENKLALGISPLKTASLKGCSL